MSPSGDINDLSISRHHYTATLRNFRLRSLNATFVRLDPTFWFDSTLKLNYGKTLRTLVYNEGFGCVDGTGVVKPTNIDIGIG